MKAAFVAVVVFVARIASAQTSNGVIDGALKDPDGSALPGVQVIANSPALITRDLTVYRTSRAITDSSCFRPGRTRCGT